MTNPVYQQRVLTAARALELGEEANWELARQTYEVTSGSNPVTITAWVEDVKTAARRPFSLGTARLFRRVWITRQEYVARGEPVPSFSDLQREISPSSHDPEVVHARQAAYYLAKAPVAQRVQAVEKLMADPEVEREYFARPATERAIPVPYVPVSLPPERDPATLITPEMDAADALTDLEEAMEVFTRRVAAVLPRVKGMPDPRTDPWARAVFMRQLAAQSRGAVEQIESLLTTGSPTGAIDHFLRDVLASGKEGKG